MLRMEARAAIAPPPSIKEPDTDRRGLRGCAEHAAGLFERAASDKHVMRWLVVIRSAKVE
eukprot:12236146-Heterocapsa_arctica.AAC.1